MKINVDKYPLGFPCTSCGQCCRKINIGQENIKILFDRYGIPQEENDYNYSWDESGKCEKLTEEGLCSVYETRPNVCNIDWFQKRLDINKNMFYDNLKSTCNQLITDANLGEEFKIK